MITRAEVCPRFYLITRQSPNRHAGPPHLTGRPSHWPPTGPGLGLGLRRACGACPTFRNSRVLIVEPVGWPEHVHWEALFASRMTGMDSSDSATPPANGPSADGSVEPLMYLVSLGSAAPFVTQP